MEMSANRLVLGDWHFRPSPSSTLGCLRRHQSSTKTSSRPLLTDGSKAIRRTTAATNSRAALTGWLMKVVISRAR